MPEAFAYTGLASAFKKAGFIECARRSETRPIMRYKMKKKKREGRVKGPKVMCRTPTPGKKGVRIDKWKYDLIRKAILKAVSKGKAGIPFRDLSKRVRENLTPAEIKELGSISWYTTTVKLDLEVRGEIERVEGAKPQRLHRP
jgi:hypothetical protein